MVNKKIVYHHQHFKVWLDYNLLPSSAVGLVWGRWLNLPTNPWTCYLLPPLCMVDVGRSTDRLQSKQKYFFLPFLHILYLPCAASSEGADWTGVGGGVSSAGLGWNKVKGNSRVTSQLDKIIDTITFSV